jgi:hypothetical protein
MIDPNKVYHVYPTNEEKEHLLECSYTVIGSPYCDCRCKPKLEEVGEGMTIIHNSFDGREFCEPDHTSRLN